MTGPILHMEKVGVGFALHGRFVRVLEDLALDIHAGEMLALVGESGSGKSMAALSVPRLLPPGAVLSGRIAVNGQDVMALPAASLRSLRGRAIGMMFQDSLAALNPSHSVGWQVAEPAMLHLGLGRRVAWARAIELLRQVGIPDAAMRARWYPHQFSGGMRQRVMLAMALSCDPMLLIADEPTTGLDAPLKTKMLDLIATLRQERRLAVLLVSHDLGLVRRHADTVHVMYAGRVAERGPARALFAQPRHPYTRALLQASPGPGKTPTGIPGRQPEPHARPSGCRMAPRCTFARPICATSQPDFTGGNTAAACFFPLSGAVDSFLPAQADMPKTIGPALLRADGVIVSYHTGLLGRRTAPVAEADLQLSEGECVAVIGGSGSGKTTLSRALLQILPYQGRITLHGEVLADLRGAARRAMCRRIGAVFQDSANALHPAMTVERLIGEAMVLGGERRAEVRRRRAIELLDTVGLPDSLMERLPGTLSGGQAQRVAIARALAAEPDVLVLDEPTSSLDVSSQAVVLTTLRNLGRARGLSSILFTHDLAAVRFLADRVLELRGGRLHAVALP